MLVSGTVGIVAVVVQSVQIFAGKVSQQQTACFEEWLHEYHAPLHWDVTHLFYKILGFFTRFIGGSEQRVDVDFL